MKSGKAAIPATLVILSAFLALQPELSLAVPMLIGCTALMVSLLALALYLGERGRFSCSPAVIMTVALLLRLSFLFAPPQLSDDIYRYLWDGGNLLRGVDPYAAAPAQVTPPPDMKRIHTMINHPEYVTIYPPAAQFIFAGGAAFGGTVTGLKMLLVAFDLGLCALLVVLLTRLELPVWRAILYAWNPLPMLEIAGSGHVDGVGLALLMAAISILLAGRDPRAEITLRRTPAILAGALVGAAGLVKIYPLILAPLLLLLAPAGRRRHFVSGLTLSLCLLIIPFTPQVANILASLDAYARNWEFSGFAFNLLRGLTGSGTTARLILSFLLFSVIASVVLCTGKKLREEQSPESAGRHVMTGCYTTAMAFLLLTPTLHPWYSLFLTAFLPFAPGPAGLVLCWAVLLTYRVQIGYFIMGEWNESASVTTAVALAPVAALLLTKASQALWKRAS